MMEALTDLVDTERGTSCWFETSQADVVGIPDPVFDEVGHAFVIAEPGTDADALRDHCRERLANYKVPKVVHLRDVLPMLAVGKIDKKSLKAEATALLEG